MNTEAKPKLIDFMPIVGLFTYFPRYFKQLRAGKPEAIVAILMEAYHLIITTIFLFGVYFKVFIS